MSTLSVQTLAEPKFTAGSEPVQLDGSLQVWAGLSYGSASLFQYLVLSGRVLIASPEIMGLVWMAATAAFVLFGVVLKVGGDRTKLADAGVRRFRAVWGSLILGAAVVIAALIILLSKLGLASSANAVVAPVALATYGIGWRVAAVLSRKAWPNFLALSCFVASPCLACLAGTPLQSLTYAVCLLAFAVLPGLYLLRQST